MWFVRKAYPNPNPNTRLSYSLDVYPLPREGSLEYWQQIEACA